MAPAGGEAVEIDGRTVRLTHQDRIYWPALGLTKGDMIAYYRAVAPVMLRYVAGRPLTLVVYNEGIAGGPRYLRALPRSAPEWLPSITYELETKEGTRQEPAVADEAGIAWYANQGALEFHMWLSRPPRLDQPDWVVLDLDPGDAVRWEQIVTVAGLARERLAGEGLSAWPKTTGGRGVHLFLPVVQAQPFDAVRAWARRWAEELAAEHPDLISAAGGATHRGDRVTIDFAQNSVTRSMAAPYSLRARPGATVSTPLRWDELLGGKVAPGDFTLRTVPERLATTGDPWQGATQHRQRLPLA